MAIGITSYKTFVLQI